MQTFTEKRQSIVGWLTHSWSRHLPLPEKEHDMEKVILSLAKGVELELEVLRSSKNVIAGQVTIHVALPVAHPRRRCSECGDYFAEKGVLSSHHENGVCIKCMLNKGDPRAEEKAAKLLVDKFPAKRVVYLTDGPLAVCDFHSKIAHLFQSSVSGKEPITIPSAGDWCRICKREDDVNNG
jgi:hypothetical protein